jgi:hypothetical protein
MAEQAPQLHHYYRPMSKKVATFFKQNKTKQNAERLIISIRCGLYILPIGKIYYHFFCLVA